MDQIISGVLRQSENSIRPEILVVHCLLAVLATIFINWVLTSLLIMLKPFTCAAILLAIIRPDLAQNVLHEDCLKNVIEKIKILLSGTITTLLTCGEKFIQKMT